MARRGQELERVIAASWESVGHTSYGPACLWRLEAEEGASASRRQGMAETPHGHLRLVVESWRRRIGIESLTGRDAGFAHRVG